MTVTHNSIPEKRPSPADMARWHKSKTSLGAVAFETQAKPEIEQETPQEWDPEAERIPENFAKAGQVFKGSDGHWYRWMPQTTRFTTNNLRLREGEDSFPLTYRGHYSHGFNQNGRSAAPAIAFTGGGWDQRSYLMQYAWEWHGRTFTGDEVWSPFENMPLDQMIHPVALGDEAAQSLGLEK